MKFKVMRLNYFMLFYRRAHYVFNLFYYNRLLYLYDLRRRVTRKIMLSPSYKCVTYHMLRPNDQHTYILNVPYP